MVALPRWIVPGPAPEPMPGPDGMPGPPVPLGRRMELPGRGTTFVRELPGPPGAPTLLLLHAWMASAGLNWFRAFAPLGEHFRVLAPDLRGHGRGIRSRQPFRLTDCADDVAMLAAVLEVPSLLAVGYSMGGPVAQLLWRRHPALVDGLVLCATGAAFLHARRDRLVVVAALAAAAGGTRVGGLVGRPGSLAATGLRALARRGGGPPEFRDWAAAELRRHDWRMVLEAGHAVSSYDARRWIGAVDVPTAVMVTTVDQLVAPRTQLRMAGAIRGATVHPVRDDHAFCARPAFVAPLVQACLEVATRAG